MIGPLPQTTLSPPDAQGDPDYSKTRQGASDLFAQLLGAAGASPLTALAPGMSPGQGMPEQLPGIAPAAFAGTQPVSGREDARETQPAPLARIFNQDGFFGRARTIELESGDEAPGLAAPQHAASAAPQGEDATVASPRGMPATAAFEMDVAAQGNASALRALDSAPEPARPAAVAGIAQPSAVAASVQPGEDEGKAGAPPAGRHFRKVQAARAPIHVAVSEVEQGLLVAARIEGLDESERRQLRDAIAALLARHGLPSARIQVNSMLLRERE